jgi:hypothetical protein
LLFCGAKRGGGGESKAYRSIAVPAASKAFGILTEKTELFRLKGQTFREDDELFTETSWAAVMMEQGITMQGHNPMADGLQEPTTRQEADAIEQSSAMS